MKVGLLIGGLCALAAGCAARDQRVLSAADVAAGCGERTPLACEAVCFRGSGAACAIFGEAVSGMADAPVRLPQDLPRGRKALRIGCDLGSLAACRELISYETDVGPPGTDCAGWESLCQRGDQRSCTFFAQCLDHSKHFRRDRAQAHRIFEEGCARGERAACRSLAFQYIEGEMVTKDPQKFFALLDQACRMDDPYACSNEGYALERGVGAPRDLARAKTLYRGACARGIRPIPCEGLRRLGEVPPSTVVSSADATESSFVSKTFDYEWRLPANWELVPAAQVELADVAPGFEVVAARPRDASSADRLIFAVTDYVAIIPGKYNDRDTTGFEEITTAWLARHGLGKTGSSHVQFYGHGAVRVESRVAGGRFLTITLFRKDRRRFELRCLSATQQYDTPCSDAIGALTIHDPPKETTDEVPRVLHLREPRFGLSYDAPDDHWLAVGPRQGLGGRQSVWVWNENGRQIDVAALDLSGAALLSFERFVDRMVDAYQKGGMTVTRGESAMSGKPCAHLELAQPGAALEQDFFLQQRGSTVFSVLVSAPKRDLGLLSRALAGLRLEEPTR